MIDKSFASVLTSPFPSFNSVSLQFRSRLNFDVPSTNSSIDGPGFPTISFGGSLAGKAEKHLRRATLWGLLLRAAGAARWVRFRCDWAYSRPSGRSGAQSCSHLAVHLRGCGTARNCRSASRRRHATRSLIWVYRFRLHRRDRRQN